VAGGFAGIQDRYVRMGGFGYRRKNGCESGASHMIYCVHKNANGQGKRERRKEPETPSRLGF
jgi:hypothetical protein